MSTGWQGREARLREVEAELVRVRLEGEQMRAEHERVVAELRTSEERFSKAFHASPDAVNLNRMVDGLYLAINRGFTEITGYTEAEVLGRTSAEIAIWANPADRARLVDGLRTRGAVDDLEADFRWKDGRVQPGVMSARILDVCGERCILSFTRDLSEWRRAQLELRQSEEKLRRLIELAVDGILLGDAKGCISGANGAACTLFGLPRDQLVGRHISELLSPSSLALRPLRFDKLMAGETLVSERAAVRPDGSNVPVEMSSRRMPDGTYQSFVRDLSERRRAEEERAAMTEQLRHAERSEALGRLAAGIAHDFNNLLTPILGAASLLARTVSKDARAEVDTILEAAQQATELTRQILAFGRKQVLSLQKLDVNAEVMRAERMLRRVIGEDIDIELHLGRPLPTAEVDPGQLHQVLMNLAVNARDAMPNGGRLEIRTSLFVADEHACAQAEGLRPGEYVRLDVSDTGQGMDAGTMQQAFEPFFTTKDPGKGTGLGLATVKGIVEQHCGALWVTSAEGIGSTFVVCLPAAKGPAATVVPAPARPIRGDESILLVEDEPLVRSIARRILEAGGYRVHVAEGAGAALRLAEAMETPPDLLVSDVIMQGAKGRELRDRLVERFPRLRTLFISGYPFSMLGAQGVLDPGVRLLAKPFSAASLCGAVRDALDDRRTY